MTRLPIIAAFFAVCAALCAAPAASAASSTDASSDAGKEGGIAGDSRGAIRALGGTTQNGFKQGDNPVDVPELGGQRSNAVGGPPAGTTGPR